MFKLFPGGKHLFLSRMTHMQMIRHPALEDGPDFSASRQIQQLRFGIRRTHRASAMVSLEKSGHKKSLYPNLA